MTEKEEVTVSGTPEEWDALVKRLAGHEFYGAERDLAARIFSAVEPPEPTHTWEVTDRREPVDGDGTMKNVIRLRLVHTDYSGTEYAGFVLFETDKRYLKSFLEDCAKKLNRDIEEDE